MPKGYALHIGLNHLNPSHYNNWDGRLLVCEADARSIEQLTTHFDYRTTLLSPYATRQNVISEIRKAAQSLESGDLFFLYYSGHGGNEIPDKNLDEDGEMDEFDETWCLYDGQLIDDELFLLWHEFKAGVRIIVVSDSCFSGDIAKAITQTQETNLKFIPKNIGTKVYQQNKVFYDKIIENINSEALKEFKSKTISDKIKATVLQFSSSQEGQVSRAQTTNFPNNSLFTAMLLKHLETYTGDYRGLIKLLKNKMPDYQVPQSQILGDKKLRILNQKPFEI